MKQYAVVTIAVFALALLAVPAGETDIDRPEAVIDDGSCFYNHTVAEYDVYACDSIGNQSGDSPTAVGVHYPNSNTIKIDSGDPSAAHIYLHELGHAMNLSHSDEGIMLPNIGPYEKSCPLGDDLQQIVDHYDIETDGCDVETYFGEL